MRNFSSEPPVSLTEKTFFSRIQQAQNSPSHLSDLSLCIKEHIDILVLAVDAGYLPMKSNFVRYHANLSFIVAVVKAKAEE